MDNLYNSVNKQRRDILKTAAVGSIATVLPFSTFAIGKSRPKLRILGTHVTLQEDLRKKAMEDLSIDLVFEPKGSAAVLQKASMAPDSFDLYEQCSNSINVLWRSGSIKPINKSRIRHWDEINSLTKTGRITPQAKIGAGDAPYKLLHIQTDGTLSDNDTNQLSY
jgi:putative spermidine/putrescine transport system substrate-binding protein